MDINNSIVDERYRSSSQSLAETDSSTMNLSISFCDLPKENKIINLVHQANDKSITETFPNLLFEIKKLRISNPNKIIIENLSINSLPNKFEQLKDIALHHIDIFVLTETKVDRNRNGGGFMIYIREDIPSKRLDEHVFPYDMEGLFVELSFRKCK